MADEEHLAILRQGVEVWNKWREANPDVRPNLSKSHLQRADLQQAHLQRADLQRARLLWADLSWADLSGANFHGAYLLSTDFTWANLYEANFTKAIFSETIFSGANLSGTIFANNDLRTVRGLETVSHQGPSEISISTLYESQGKIPEVFLRGCGVPDNLIDYLPSLTGTAIEFYSCFISYSTKDDAFAKRLHSRMQQEHMRVWFAPHDLKGGHKLRDQIDDAIRVYDKLLLILSDASMASDWVAHEIRRAFARERAEGKRVLFPIRLCDFEALTDWELPDDMGRDLALEVRHYYIPNFSNWKDHDVFEATFAQLLKALRADEKKAIKS